MGLLDQVTGKETMSPLTKVLLALLAAKAASSYFGKDDAKPGEAKAPSAPEPSGTIQSGILAGMPSLGSLFGQGGPKPADAPAPGSAGPSGQIESGILAGLPSLDALLGTLRGGGLGDKVDSWVGAGENKPVAPHELDKAIDAGTLDELAKETGRSKDILLKELSDVLPKAIDRLTPGGTPQGPR